MKKTWVMSFVFTLVLIFLPPFLVDLGDEEDVVILDDVQIINLDKDYNEEEIMSLVTSTNLKEISYNIDVDLTNEHISVYKDNVELREFLCSVSKLEKSDLEDLLGKTVVKTKGTLFFSAKDNQEGRYYIKFLSNYLIYSIPEDEKGNIIEEEKDRLGIPVSHGCIRVSAPESKWLYDNVPVGANVSIHY